MSRGLATLGELGHIPLRDLGIAQAALLEVSAFMTDIRVHAARLKTKPELRQWETSHSRYLQGRLHGCVFSFMGILIYQTGDHDYFDELATSAMNEAEFLLGAYLYGDCDLQ